MTDVMVLPAPGLPSGILRRRGKIQVKRRGQDRLVRAFLLGFTAIAAWLFSQLQVDWWQLLSRVPNLVGTFGRLGQLSLERFDLTWAAFLETVAIAVLSTVYSLIAGMFIAAFAARNLVRNRVTPLLITSLATFARTLPTPVVVLLAMASFGLGPVPGIVGITLSSTAFFVRAFAQGYEDVPAGTIEAFQGAGASRLQIFFCAVLPSTLSHIVAWTGLRFEMNFTGSAILGMVGAGGVGAVITRSIQGHEFGVAGVAILLVFVFAYTVELTFTQIKKKYFS